MVTCVSYEERIIQFCTEIEDTIENLIISGLPIKKSIYDDRIYYSVYFIDNDGDIKRLSVAVHKSNDYKLTTAGYAKIYYYNVELFDKYKISNFSVEECILCREFYFECLIWEFPDGTYNLRKVVKKLYDNDVDIDIIFNRVYDVIDYIRNNPDKVIHYDRVKEYVEILKNKIESETHKYLIRIEVFNPDDFEEIKNTLLEYGDVKITSHREIDYDGAVSDVYLIEFTTNLDYNSIVDILNNFVYPLVSIKIKKVS